MRLGVRLGSPFLRPVVIPPNAFPSHEKPPPDSFSRFDRNRPFRARDRLAFIEEKMFAFNYELSPNSR